MIGVNKICFECKHIDECLGSDEIEEKGQEKFSCWEGEKG